MQEPRLNKVGPKTKQCGPPDWSKWVPRLIHAGPQTEPCGPPDWTMQAPRLNHAGPQTRQFWPPHLIILAPWHNNRGGWISLTLSDHHPWVGVLQKILKRFIEFYSSPSTPPTLLKTGEKVHQRKFDQFSNSLFSVKKWPFTTQSQSLWHE